MLAFDHDSRNCQVSKSCLVCQEKCYSLTTIGVVTTPLRRLCYLFVGCVTKSASVIHTRVITCHSFHILYEFLFHEFHRSVDIAGQTGGNSERVLTVRFKSGDTSLEIYMNTRLIPPHLGTVGESELYVSTRFIFLKKLGLQMTEPPTF